MCALRGARTCATTSVVFWEKEHLCPFCARQLLGENNRYKKKSSENHRSTRVQESLSKWANVPPNSCSAAGPLLRGTNPTRFCTCTGACANPCAPSPTSLRPPGRTKSLEKHFAAGRLIDSPISDDNFICWKGPLNVDRSDVIPGKMSIQNEIRKCSSACSGQMAPLFALGGTLWSF